MEEVKKKTEKRRNPNALMIVIGVIIGLYSISLFVPIVWGFITSFKDKLEFRGNMFGLPQVWKVSNYITVLKAFYVPVESGLGTKNIYVAQMFLNSVLYAVGSALVQTMVQYIMAYLSARFKYKFGKAVYAVVIFALAFPSVGTTASSLYVAYKLHLVDSIPGLYVIKAYFLGMYFLVFYEQLKAFPKDFSDAAYVDGAGNFTVMFRITFPLVSKTFFTIALLLFIAYWNDYTTPMLYMPNVPTLSYGLYYFSDLSRINVVNNTPMRLAACMMMMVPVLVLFLIFHNRLIGNVSMGGLKE